MKWLCKLGIHGRKYVKAQYAGVIIDAFRICRRCGKVQTSSLNGWKDSSPKKVNSFLERIENEDATYANNFETSI